MKFYFLGLMSFCFFSLTAQQNFFNVPSSDITPKKKVFFQQQFNLSQGTWQSNSTLSIGLGKNFEVGANVLGVTMNPSHPLPLETEANPLDGNPLAPLTLFNAQKSWNICSFLKVAVGTQAGLNISDIRNIHFSNYNYANLAGMIEKTETKLVGGIYYGNNNYFGEGRRSFLAPRGNGIGFQLGMEQPIIKHKLSFQADYISGRHTMGETVLGACYYPFKHLALSAGWQIPNPHSTSQTAGVIEITYLP